LKQVTVAVWGRVRSVPNQFGTPVTVIHFGTGPVLYNHRVHIGTPLVLFWYNHPDHFTYLQKTHLQRKA